MKILHLAKVYAPIGGIETYVLDLLPLLEKAGHENVLIYRQEHSRTLPTNGKPIYHVPVTQSRGEVTAIINNEKPDVIYLHDVYDPVLIKQVAQLAPAIGYIHIFYPVCPGLGKLYRRGDEICTRPFGLGCIPMMYLRRCCSARHPRSVYNIMQQTKLYLSSYKTLPRIVVASSYMKELMIQNGMEGERVKILPPHFISNSNGTEATTPDPNNRNILFVGRLDYEKGIPYLLKAFRTVPQPYRLIIAGDGSLRSNYIQLAKDLGVADKVQFTGWLSDEELEKAYQRCIATVMPTIMPEPFGKVGIEAMTHGRPVVAFDVGGISDWLKDGYNGFLVPPRDIDQLATRLTQLLSDPQLAKQMGQNGRKYVEQNYLAQQHIDGLIDIFQSVATQQRV